MFFKRKKNRSNRIRVLVNGIHAKSGGGVTYLRNLLPLLANDKSLELHLFVNAEQLLLFPKIDAKVKVHPLHFPSGFLSTLFWEQFLLPIRARKMSIDVTLSPANYGPLLAPKSIILLRNSLAVARRERRILKRLYWSTLRVMTALSLIKCEKAIAVSLFAQKTLTVGFGTNLQNKVSVIYHGVNEEFQPSINTKREPFILTVSDIYIQKNIHTLIKAFAVIRKKMPNLTLKIAGKAIDQNYLLEIKESIISENLDDAVEFLGTKSTQELIRLYQSCALFVFPSTVETFGNPLVEAMACGAPIVSSDSSAMPEILKDAAKYFDPENEKDMADTVLSVLENESERH